jgi:extracellular elastinolytic metalloproteinase
MDALSDPHTVAKTFIEDILNDQLTSDSSYKIRQDSYTDKNTGVSHIYVRQVVNGLEVTDGDMNLNIKDGMVLSYGNSVSPSSSRSVLLKLTPLDSFITGRPQCHQ